MRIENSIGTKEVAGIEEYLNYLSVGDTAKLRVEIRPAQGTNWRGLAGWNTIRLYLPSKPLQYPYAIIDRYMHRYKSLEPMKQNPRVANNILELAGFIFLHELKHTKYHKSSRYRESGTKGMQIERYCTEFAYENWKPCPEDIITKGLQKLEEMVQIGKLQMEKRSKESAFRESPAGKLQELNSKIKVWETKLKRAETFLKKLNRSKKLWERKADATQTLVPESEPQLPDSAVDTYNGNPDLLGKITISGSCNEGEKHE